MSIRHLDQLLKPASIAVVGASERVDSRGAAVWQALQGSGFHGPLHAVNLRAQALVGVRAVPRVSDLPTPPDLAFVCTPPHTVPTVVAELAAAGTRAAVIVTPGLTAAQRSSTLDSARGALLRVLGDGSFGIASPLIGLQGGLFRQRARPGSLALVGTCSTAIDSVLGWAAERPIGFSHIVSVGTQADVDFGDLLDYLASDAATRAILLHIEEVVQARKFMAAARAAARNKPVIVLRSGRARDEAADKVYDAAIRRAGMLRVHGLDGLLLAAHALGRPRVAGVGPLTVLANGPSAAALAADACLEAGVRLAALAPTTAAVLAKALDEPADRTPANPVDIGPDAPPERHSAALHALLADASVGPVLWVHAAQAQHPLQQAAEACLPALQARPGQVLACWLGEPPSNDVATALEAVSAGIYASPDQAVAAFAMLQTYRANQETLLETPETGRGPAADLRRAREIVGAAVAARREALEGAQAVEVLRACGVLPGFADACASATRGASDEAPLQAYVGARVDPVFGPVVQCGPPADGDLATARSRSVVALPPLNRALARELICRSGLAASSLPRPVSKEVDGLCDALIGIAQLLADLPDVASLDIPCWACGLRPAGSTPVLQLSPASAAGPERFAILPYPSEWVQTLPWNGRTIVVRPIRPEDEAQHRRFLQRLTPEDIRLRIFQTRRELAHSELARLTQIDYEREMAFIVEDLHAPEGPETLAVGRLARDPDNREAEFALLVRSDLKGHGLGRLLIERLIAYARSRSTPRMVALVLRENAAMLALARAEGFRVEPDPQPGPVLRLSRSVP